MLSLFLASLALGKVYVLTPPFNFTRPDEIGRWSARGMATTRKTSLKLVEEPTRERTFLCQRVPYNVCAHEWVPGEGENFTLKCHCGFGCDQNQYSLAPP